jgi:serine protease SohB
MWEILLETLMFALKTGIVVLSVVIIILVIGSIVSRQQWEDIGQIRVRKLNEVYKAYGETVESAGMEPKSWKHELKKRQKEERHQEPPKKKLYVLDFDGDLNASDVHNLREKISAILKVATPDDEVLLRLESSGGVVQSYGLAASQLARIRDRKIHLTIAVDKVAASGGYMMAVLADRLIAAPFAVIGSIGVMTMMPNLHRFLKEHKVDFLQLSAGEYKTTLTPMGEVTEKALNKTQEELEETHELFKTFIAENRPTLDLEKVATGETWFGRQALALNLVDVLQTSDDFIMGRFEDAQVLLVDYQAPQTLRDKVSGMVGQASEHTVNKIWQKLNQTSRQQQ